MNVKELIEILNQYPQDAIVGKVDLSDDSGDSDTVFEKKDIECIDWVKEDGEKIKVVIISYKSRINNLSKYPDLAEKEVATRFSNVNGADYGNGLEQGFINGVDWLIDKLEE